jgi:hypothetical protein
MVSQTFCGASWEWDGWWEMIQKCLGRVFSFKLGRFNTAAQNGALSTNDRV